MTCASRLPLCCLLLALVAAGCDSGQIERNGTSPDAGPLSADAGLPGADSAPSAECVDNADCEGGGFCVAGSCCATEAQVCGDRCCGASSVCFANACVEPGKACLSAGDCGKGQYCEPSLGEDALPGAGNADKDAADGQVCLRPKPRAGRCLALPARCEPGDEGDDCLPACEVRPDGGDLQAMPQWTWGPGTASVLPDQVDVWSTPVVGRVTDTNCDGEINELDPPNLIFVSSDVKGTCCHCEKDAPSNCTNGVLRVLDGASGKEIWSLERASADSTGFAGVSLALGDVDGDGRIDIVAATGEGHIALIDGSGKVRRVSDKPVPGFNPKNFGWGGGLALADVDADGAPEVAFGATTFSTKGDAITLHATGDCGTATAANRSLSLFADVDGADDGHLELVVGRAAYRPDGSAAWCRDDLTDGYPAVGDFNLDGKPEVVLVAKGELTVLDGATGATLAGPLTLPGTGSGGPPTVADFDGDGTPEVGVAKADFYSVTEVDLAKGELATLWKQQNHDFSSSVTGSTVFDFEGDGSAEVVYNDECFLWVYDGKTGKVRFATPTNSFTATEASLVADVDGDGRAEMVMIANSASPTSWKCDVAPWNAADPELNRPAWTPPKGGTVHRGITLWRDARDRWVGTRTLWNQHSYHVTNICDSRDDACLASFNRYGAVPPRERSNWAVPWLNNFRQNVQDKGLFDAPDATVTLRVPCASPVELHATVRNLGLALLPAGVKVGYYLRRAPGDDQLLATKVTDSPLFPGQGATLVYVTEPKDGAGVEHEYVAKILTDPKQPTFNECRTDNNASPPARSPCNLR